jgi:hypothetical protein
MPMPLAQRMTCSRCKRTVRVEHEHCGGEPGETCHSYGCGLQIYRTVWEDRARRAYCTECYIAFTQRQRDREQDLLDEEARTTSASRSTMSPGAVSTVDDYEENDVPLQNAPLLTPHPPPSSERVLMNIHPDVRERLRALLQEPEMRGMGYSAFVNSAISEAWEELQAVREPDVPRVTVTTTSVPPAPQHTWFYDADESGQQLL